MRSVFTSHVQKTVLIICLPQQTHSLFMSQITYQPEFRPALLDVIGCKEYREERDLFVRIDEILTLSGLEKEFVELSILQSQPNLKQMSAAQTDVFIRGCHMALRGNIARLIKNLPHREFCKLLPDSHILRWFVGVERIDGVKAYAKSTSDRFAHWLSEESLQYLNQKLIGLLANVDQDVNLNLNLENKLNFENVYFDSTCLKADIHFPVDWVLLRDLTRTLMKATLIIRREGLKNRMPQEPLDFLSDINSLVMKMTANNRVKDGKKKRKSVFREMKTLARKITNHARNHLKLLEIRGDVTNLTLGRQAHLKERLENILDQVDPAIHQAHERIIGGRKLNNKDKILSLYDSDVDVIVRGKDTANVEFGNKLWLGETSEGLIADYLLEKNQSNDAKHVLPSLKRLTEDQRLPISHVWGDRGLDSATNAKSLASQGIYNGLCPKKVTELQTRLEQDPQLGAGLKRRASTEARISILIKKFMGDKPRAKGFEHRQMMVGWAVFTHNLWVLARLRQKSTEEEQKAA